MDVGCGMGFFLEIAKQRGWEVFGSEYSKRAVEICESKGIKMFNVPITQSDYCKGQFDVILSIEVMEHIYNPIEEIQTIYSLLRCEGLFYCTTPNFNSLLRYYLKEKYDIITYPEHLSYYTYKTLNRLLSQTGLRKIKFLSTGISFSQLKTAHGKGGNYINPNSEDERLRQNIDRKWYLAILKKLINSVLTLSRSGMTLKAYYIKSLK